MLRFFDSFISYIKIVHLIPQNLYNFPSNKKLRSFASPKVPELINPPFALVFKLTIFVPG